jgi:hypothetical protein
MPRNSRSSTEASRFERTPIINRAGASTKCGRDLGRRGRNAAPRLILANAAFAAAAIEAKKESIEGDWTFSVERIGLKLTLEQRQSTITETPDWRHVDPVKLTAVSATTRWSFPGLGHARVSLSI